MQCCFPLDHEAIDDFIRPSPSLISHTPTKRPASSLENTSPPPFRVPSRPAPQLRRTAPMAASPSPRAPPPSLPSSSRHSQQTPQLNLSGPPVQAAVSSASQADSLHDLEALLLGTVPSSLSSSTLPPAELGATWKTEITLEELLRV